MTGAFIKNDGGRIDLSLGSKSNRVEVVITNGVTKAILFLNEEELEQLGNACDLFKTTLSDRKHRKEMEDLDKKLGEDDEE